MMNVPKFASFRPKPQPTLDSASPPKDEVNSGNNSRTRDRHRSSHGRSSRKEGRNAVLEPSLPVDKRPAELDLFVVDKRGDEKNLVYGSNHRYAIPLFHRIGAGSVLGVTHRLKIQREVSDDKVITLLDSRELRAGKREKYAFSKMEKPRLLRIRQEAFTKNPGLETDFIPLELPRGKKRKRHGETLSDSSGSENESRNYRSIHGKAKSDQPSDTALQYATQSDSSGNEDAMNDSTSARTRNADLSREVEKSPHDMESWLALIAHQDVLLQGDDEFRRISNAEMRSTADIKIHMYEKALEKANSLKDRERMLQGMMAEGSKIWEARHQAEKWERISQDNIDSISLWKSYVHFKQTAFGMFRFEQIRELYSERFKFLLKEIAKSNVDGSVAFYQQLIYVLLRFTLFLRESGYIELSVAIWQANFEINFRSPISFKDMRTDFQDYWDSEISRIGEADSLGWAHFFQNPDSAMPAAVHVDEQGNVLERREIFRSWAISERTGQKLSHTPAKTMDDTVEDDPFRVILFSDIEDFLFLLPPTSETLRQSLLDAFLSFCRLPPISPHLSDWKSDPLANGEILEVDIDWINTQHPTSNHADQERPILSALISPCQNFIGSSDTLFSQHWYRNLEPWEERYKSKKNGPICYAWLRNTLKQLLESRFSDNLAEYFLAFEWINEPATIKKTAKGLLKKHSDSIRLYNAYAMIESSRGNKEVASAVFTAALTMSSATEEKRVGAILLWKSLIWSCLEDGDNESALKHLLSIADGSPNASVEASPTAIIRAKHFLSSNRDYLLTSGDVQHSILFAECLSLLEYLSLQSRAQGDITLALTSLTTSSQAMTSRGLTHSPSHELLLQSSARLLFQHARTGPFRPSLLREKLDAYLGIFPNNTIFLSLFSWNESRFRIEGRVRKILTSPKRDVVSSHLFRIRWEMQNGTIYSARSAFEAALASPTSNSSPDIWKLYLVFTVRHFRARAKDIWYRALRACPWVKELYIAGFECVEEKDVGFEELERTWRVMAEKELRVHVDLEEVLEDLKDRR